MSGPNYQFGLKCIFVRREVNERINQFAKQVEALVYFHKTIQYESRFSAYDVVAWPQFPQQQVRILVDADHPFGNEVIDHWNKVDYTHYLLKRDVEEETSCMSPICEFVEKQEELTDLNRLRSIVEILRSEFGSRSGYLNTQQDEVLTDFFCKTIQARRQKSSIYPEDDKTAFFKQPNPAELSQLQKTLREILRPSFMPIPHSRNTRNAADVFGEEWEARFQMNQNARISLGLKFQWNEGFTLCDATTERYIQNLNLLGVYLDAKKVDGLIDVTRPEDELLVTIEEVADFITGPLVDPGDGSADEEKAAKEKAAKEEAMVAKVRLIKSNSSRGLIAGLETRQRIRPLLNFEPSKRSNPQDGYCAYELSDKLVPKIIGQEDKERFLEDMHDRSIRRRS